MHTALGSLRLRSRGAHCDRILAVEVQGCTLRSDPLRLRSRGAHCDRILAVEVQGCTLRGESLRSRGAHCDPELAKIGEADWR